MDASKWRGARGAMEIPGGEILEGGKSNAEAACALEIVEPRTNTNPHE